MQIEDEKTDPGIEVPSDLGPLTSLMKDPTITDIMINDLRNVMVEKEGKPLISGISFKSPKELDRLLQTILRACGRTLDPDHPYLDASLPDGSRVNIVMPPLASQGLCITIRKFPVQRMSLEDLVQREMLDQKIGTFLKACVVGRRNILVVGGTGSGKTTLLNAMVQMVPKSERIITIEDTREITIPHANHVHMIAHADLREKNPVTARELVANALRMRPDRIIVGECRRGEAFDMLQAMNTGHQGSMTTLHANSPRDGLFRLETLCLMGGVEMPLIAIRKQINSALDLIVQIKRFRSGKRRVTQISEVTGIEGDTITLQDLFRYETSDPANTAKSDAGKFVCTGLVPTFLDRLADEGVELPRQFFA